MGAIVRSDALWQAQHGDHQRSCIVIAEVESDGDHQDLGMVVDSVSEVLEIPTSEIEPAPSFGAKIRSDFISGMGKVYAKFMILLSMGKVLSVDDLSMLPGVAAQDQK